MRGDLPHFAGVHQGAFLLAVTNIVVFLARKIHPANQDGVQSLIDQMLAVNSRITAVEGQLRELEAKIQEKFVKYGLKIEQMTEFGSEIRKTTEMMTGITQASKEFMIELEKYDVWREEIYDNNLP